MLQRDKTVLAIVDVQGKLARVVHQSEALIRHLQILIQGARILGVPVLWAEQNPAGLGPTVPEVASLLTGLQPIAKTSFSCCGSEPFLQQLQSSGRRQVLLAGIEGHVCVYLTGADLLARGYEVEVVADAVSSRSPENKQIGLEKLRRLNADISCTETVLFELLGRAEGQEFKDILRLLK